MGIRDDVINLDEVMAGQPEYEEAFNEGAAHLTRPSSAAVVSIVARSLANGKEGK